AAHSAGARTARILALLRGRGVLVLGVRLRGRLVLVLVVRLRGRLVLVLVVRLRGFLVLVRLRGRRALRAQGQELLARRGSVRASGLDGGAQRSDHFGKSHGLFLVWGQRGQEFLESLDPISQARVYRTAPQEGSRLEAGDNIDRGIPRIGDQRKKLIGQILDGLALFLALVLRDLGLRVAVGLPVPGHGELE